MRNDVSFEKTRAFKSKPKLFYEKFFYFVSIALGSLHPSASIFIVLHDETQNINVNAVKNIVRIIINTLPKSKEKHITKKDSVMNNNKIEILLYSLDEFISIISPFTRTYCRKCLQRKEVCRSTVPQLSDCRLKNSNQNIGLSPFYFILSYIFLFVKFFHTLPPSATHYCASNKARHSLPLEGKVAAKLTDEVFVIYLFY